MTTFWNREFRPCVDSAVCLKRTDRAAHRTVSSSGSGGEEVEAGRRHDRPHCAPYCALRC